MADVACFFLPNACSSYSSRQSDLPERGLFLRLLTVIPHRHDDDEDDDRHIDLPSFVRDLRGQFSRLTDIGERLLLPERVVVVVVPLRGFGVRSTRRLANERLDERRRLLAHRLRRGIVVRLRHRRHGIVHIRLIIDWIGHIGCVITVIRNYTTQRQSPIRCKSTTKLTV